MHLWQLHPAMPSAIADLRSPNLTAAGHRLISSGIMEPRPMKGWQAMNGAVGVEYAVRLECCAAENPLNPMHIVLPHQSPLGMFEYPRYLFSREWPATFLCLRHSRSFVLSGSNVRLEKKRPDQDRSYLWRIQSECGYENCGRLHVIYISVEMNAAELVDLLVCTTPSIACDGHELVWGEDSIRRQLL
jgi:hypothetical protein